MAVPSECRYSESHEWFAADGDVVTVGITRFAADELTDITFAEMKPAGTPVRSGESVGEVESVKTATDVYAFIEGEIIEVNEAVGEDPSLINTDPFGAGWLVKIRVEDTAPLEALMDHDTYERMHPVG